VNYAYRCTAELIEFEVEGPPADMVQCRCGEIAKRIRQFAVNKPSLKSQGRWDPVVGQWVDNDRQFREILKAGQEREAKDLNMDVPLVQVDARDHEALGELHGTGVDHRKEVLEQSKRQAHDEKVVANHEQKPKVLTG
jgi:hypothetical protein